MRVSLRCTSKVLLPVFILLCVVTLMMHSFPSVPFHHAVFGGVLNMYSFNTQQSEYSNIQSTPEVVHIGVVHVGYGSTIEFYMMLKSIYMYRSGPLHFHIIVDDKSQDSISTLFQTWNVPQVNVSFYNINFMANLLWMAAKTNQTDFVKLMFPEVVSLNAATKIIVIDTDLLFLDDVVKLWRIFDNFKSKHVIGIAETENNGWLETIKKHQSGSDVGNRFTPSVVLYQLEHFQAVRPGESTNRNITDKLAAITEDTVYHLPCQWSMQLNDEDYRCLNSSTKTVKWNLITTFNETTKNADHLKIVRATLFEYNGDVLKQLPPYTTKTSTTTTNPTLECQSFREAQHRLWRTLPFFRAFRYNATKDDVTAVSQLDYYRIGTLEQFCARWSGPVSVTFYVNDLELHKCSEFIETSEVLRNRLNIAYHAIFKEGSYYPINALRNVAWSNSVTPYVFLVDIDFLPLEDSYTTLKRYIGSMNDMRKKALVVPAFQTRPNAKIIPKNKMQLLAMFKKRIVFAFSYKAFPPGHRPTNYDKWKTATAPYKIEWQQDYEPYVVVPRNAPRYDSRFVGYGSNKLSQIMELEGQGYEFIVLPDASIIHKDHPPSNDKKVFMTSSKYITCLNDFIKQLYEELSKKYDRTFVFVD